MNLAPIIELLKAGLSGYRVIGGALELAAAQDAVPALPALYVVPGEERGQDNEEVGGHAQPVDASFSVFLMLPAKGAASVAAAGSDLISLRTAEVDTLLLGQLIGDVVEPIAFVSGQIVAIDPGSLTWEIAYRTRYYKRKSS